MSKLKMRRRKLQVVTPPRVKMNTMNHATGKLLIMLRSSIVQTERETDCRRKATILTAVRIMKTIRCLTSTLLAYQQLQR